MLSLPALSVLTSPQHFLAPQPVPRAFLIPLRSGFEIIGSGSHVVSHFILIQSDTEPRAVRNGYPAAIDNRWFDALDDQRGPPGYVKRMVLKRQKVLGCSRTVHVRHAGDRGAGKVQSHGDAVLLGHVADLVRLEDTAGCSEVRLNLADGMLVTKYSERLFQVDVLSREDRSRTLVRNLFEQIGVHPRNHVLHPRQVVFLVRLAQTDDRLHSQMAQMIHRERNFHPDGVAHSGDVRLEHGDPFVSYLHTQQRMWKLVRLPLLQVGRISDRAGGIRHHLDSEIHLEPRKTHNFLALFQSLRIDFGILRLRSIGINADLIAKLAASDERVDGSVVDLAGDVP